MTAEQRVARGLEQWTVEWKKDGVLTLYCEKPEAKVHVYSSKSEFDDLSLKVVAEEFRRGLVWVVCDSMDVSPKGLTVHLMYRNPSSASAKDVAFTMEFAFAPAIAGMCERTRPCLARRLPWVRLDGTVNLAMVRREYHTSEVKGNVAIKVSAYAPL